MNPNHRYELFDKVYDDPHKLNYVPGEKNEWFFALFNYSRCYQKYYSTLNSIQKIKSELDRPDINDVCKNELDEVRKAANNGLTYKEVNGGNSIFDERMM